MAWFTTRLAMYVPFVRTSSTGIRGPTIFNGKRKSQFQCAHFPLILTNAPRHVRVHHVDKQKDDPDLRKVLAQRPEGSSRGRRRRVHP